MYQINITKLLYRTRLLDPYEAWAIEQTAEDGKEIIVRCIEVIKERGELRA